MCCSISVHDESLASGSCLYLKKGYSTLQPKTPFASDSNINSQKEDKMKFSPLILLLGVLGMVYAAPRADNREATIEDVFEKLFSNKQDDADTESDVDMQGNDYPEDVANIEDKEMFSNKQDDADIEYVADMQEDADVQEDDADIEYAADMLEDADMQESPHYPDVDKEAALIQDIVKKMMQAGDYNYGR